MAVNASAVCDVVAGLSDASWRLALALFALGAMMLVSELVYWYASRRYLEELARLASIYRELPVVLELRRLAEALAAETGVPRSETAAQLRRIARITGLLVAVVAILAALLLYAAAG